MARSIAWVTPSGEDPVISTVLYTWLLMGGTVPAATLRRSSSRVSPRVADGHGAGMIDTGPPIALIAIGLVLWLAIDATLAGISIQTIGVILAVVGVIWLVIELFQASGRRRTVVAREEPVVVRERQREIY